MSAIVLDHVKYDRMGGSVFHNTNEMIERLSNHQHNHVKAYKEYSGEWLDVSAATK